MNKAIFALLIVAASCAQPIFDVTKFLDVEVNGLKVPIVTSICMEETKFQIIKQVITPEEISKGEDISIKVQGAALTDLVIKNLYLVTQYNGADIFTDNKDQGNTAVATGEKYVYSYTASVPTFTPAGTWDIFLKLQDANNEVISCLKAQFVME